MASSSSAADVSITREQLTKYFHLPITDVAKELGICATMLKKICRKNGIPRWPHRKIKSLNKMIESLEASLTNDGSEAGECIRQEIIILKNKKSLIMRNPSILVQGNSNKRSSEGGDEQPAGKKARAEAIQAPVTTFNNPKSSLPTAPNSFSINQLLTPPTNFSSPLTSATGMDEKDYRAYAHHASAHGYPPHHMIMPYSDPSRPDSKSHMEGRSFSSPLTSYLPEDDGRHMEGAPMMHSSDPYYYHKLAYQYYPRQMLPPSAYPPPPPHTLSASPHHARSSYYLPFGGPSSHEARPGQQHLITDGHSEASPTGDLQEQQTQQPHHPQQPTSTPSQQQTQQTQNQQQAQQQITQAQKTQQQQQQQQQQQLTQRATMQQQQQQTQPQQTQQQQESLPKMNIPSSSPDMYKYARNPPSPQSSSTSSPFPQGSEMPYYYHQYPTSQTQRLHQQQ